MKSILTSLIIFLFLSNTNGTSRPTQDIGQQYIENWKAFYPSKALDQGMHPSIFYYEDFALEKINEWLTFNKNMLKLLSDSASPYVTENSIDARLLRIQVQKEIDKWEREAPHQNSLSLYAMPIANAVDEVLEAAFLTTPEKNSLVCQRLESVQQLCAAATESLKKGDREGVERSLKRLESAEDFYKNELPEIASNWYEPPNCEDFASRCLATAESIHSLIAYVNSEVLPKAKESDLILGRDEYARQFSLYTDNLLTPEMLAELARKEIEHVRKLIGEVSGSYLKKQYPGRTIPKSYDALVSAALADMEKDAPESGAEYLEFWRALSDSAIKFIEEYKIATLPKYQTLQIIPAPESAGAAARIGWVDSAPPFAPNPLTTLYLPSIPESFPEQERRDFWSSFNKPFNRMIVIHELFPGHYMQIKISRESPHPVRLLFPYALYFEGWATFAERVVLDAGWERDNPLTFLAHLRKRLENANRAYTSVQVHCNGWDQEKVMQFSAETSLLAPQFAKSLWGRLMRSPMQLTSYFLGGVQFTELLASEQERLGEQFQLQDFMDTIMRAGPIPMDEFSKIFSQTISR